jgi:hypothetical protein
MSTQTARPPAVAPPKMKLAVSTGRRERPLWVHLYAIEGLGKTTFAADAPSPIFIDIEGGTFEKDVARFTFEPATDNAAERTAPKDWNEVQAALRLLASERHPYKTVVIDTLDALESLIHASICARDGQANIESYGYGKGYVAAVDEWRIFVSLVERIRATGVNVVTLAHAIVKSFKNPTGDDFDRYQMKLHEKAGGLIKERSDVVLFGNYETIAVKDPKTKRAKGVSTGARLIYTTRTAAHDAKNRHDLPEVLPLSWDDFATAVKAHRPADPAALAAECERKAKELGGDVEAKAAAYITQNTGNAASLAKLNDRLNALLSERQTAEEGQ